MKHISVKMSDSEYEKVNLDRGSKTISEYVRETLLAAHEDISEEASAFHKLLADVTALRGTLEGALRDIPSRTSLLLLGQYLAKVITMGNPPTFAHYTRELEQLFQSLKTSLTDGVKP